jgi:hypothetical protein
MNLYEITQEAQYLAALLETEELTPELEQELLINQEQLQIKGINYAKVISNYQGESDQIDAEIKRLKAMKESRDKKVTWLTESLKKAMLDVVEALPASFQNVKNVVTADKMAIKEAIKKGETVFGARIIENFNLQIK